METKPVVNRRIRLAAVLGLLGLLLVSVFLWWGYNPWTVGLSIFLGTPLLLVAIGIYLSAVWHDLRERGVL